MRKKGTYGLRLEPLYEDTVKERHNGPNGLERRLDRLHTTKHRRQLFPSSFLTFVLNPHHFLNVNFSRKE